MKHAVLRRVCSSLTTLILFLTWKGIYVCCLTDTGHVSSMSEWNIGLEEAGNNARFPAIVQALNQSNSTAPDIVCVTELWGGPRRVLALRDALTANYPYFVSLVSDDDVDNAPYAPVCTIPSLANDVNVLHCITSTLPSPAAPPPLNELFEVCIKHVLASLIGQNDPCWACLLEMAFAYYSKTKTLLEALDYCFTDTSQRWIQTLGIALLSRVPLRNITVGYYPTYLAPRGYISVLLPEQDGIQLICTHFTPPQTTIPYIANVTTPFASWDEENRYNAITLTSYLDDCRSQFQNEAAMTNDNSSSSGNRMIHTQIVMGDLNHSPSIPEFGIVGVYTDAFQAMNQSMKYCPYVEQVHMCTACPDNNIIPEAPQGMIYDHLWMRCVWDNLKNDDDDVVDPCEELLETTLASRVWDQTVRVSNWEICDGSNYATCKQPCTQTKLSDHYGVRLDFWNTTTTPRISSSNTSTSVVVLDTCGDVYVSQASSLVLGKVSRGTLLWIVTITIAVLHSILRGSVP